MFSSWKKFFRIESNDLFWIRRDEWPKGDVDLITKYVDKGFEWYKSKCSNEFYPEDVMLVRNHENFLNDPIFLKVISEFMNDYSERGIESAGPGIGQCDFAVISTRRKAVSNHEEIPMYYKGVIVK